MKIFIAIDSFKGSLSSMQAGMAAAEGFKRVFPDCEVLVSPVADGGEGTTEALCEGMGGRWESVKVSNPLGREITSRYAILEESKTAIIEMSAAAGITLISDGERNPLNTTTYGVGQMILDAIEKGCRNFLIGIGGSATNDGGVGMLQALGFKFCDSEGNDIPFGAKGLEKLSSINGENVSPCLSECAFSIACDVTNPLCGNLGCSAIYGPQKGADVKMIKDMDMWLSNYAALAKSINPSADENANGAGAAGGMGFAFMSFLNGELKNGIELVLKETKAEEKMRDCDLVITGEGRLDGQSAMGKAPCGVSKIAKKYNIPVVAFSGAVTKDATECNKNGIDAFFPILRSVCTLDEAMNVENARENMMDTAEQVARLIKTFKER